MELLQRRKPRRARAALNRHKDPVAAWRDLFGGDDPHRRFLHSVGCGRCNGSGRTGEYGYPDGENEWTCGPCQGTGDDPSSPIDSEPDERHVLALGDSVDAVREAETMARETARRVVAWGSPPAEDIVWRVAFPEAHAEGAFTWGIPAGISLTIGYLLDMLLGRTDWPADVHPLIREDTHQHARWEAAAQRDLKIPDAITYHTGKQGPVKPPSLVGASFADLPNPYAPLLRVWSAGFAIHWIKDGAIHMYASPASLI